MSRSYKKHPCWYAGKCSSAKRAANKAVRRAKDVPNGGGYKKVFESYDICDNKFPQTRNSARLDYEAHSRGFSGSMFDSLDEAMENWERNCYRK